MCAFTKRCFLCVTLIFQALNIWAYHGGNINDSLNLMEFTFYDINKCKTNEFYDLDIFSCVSCGREDENLQSTADKLSCECAPNFVTVAMYDTEKKNPICIKRCDDYCQDVRANDSKVSCEFKLINFTHSNNYYLTRSGTTSRPIRLTYDDYHINDTRICNICDLKYNFRYLDYCIGNQVLKPYLKYNSIWQSIGGSDMHFGDLKFVAFFCLSLHNSTACNQLANLCIMSHFSADKNSPCSLLTQLSDVVIKYASMDENVEATKPSLFFKRGEKTAKMMMEPLSVGTNSKEHPQPEEWQLVKRFQLIEAQYRQQNKHSHQRRFEDEFKLTIYRSITYAEYIELHYDIYNNNQIGLPLVKLRYRHLDLTTNVTLHELQPFKLQITFARAGEDSQRKLMIETLLPIFLLAALIMALLQLYNYRQRRTGLVSTATTAEIINSSLYLVEFLLHFISYAANAILLCFIIYMCVYPLQFLVQGSIEITLPIMKDDQSLLEILIYSAFSLRFIFTCVHFWYISRFDLFLIDWERPRSCDNNHFILKNNLETSSVCSSVRTYTSENVSTWRIFYVTNEWIRLSVKQKHSTALQGLLVLPLAQFFISESLISKDLALQLFIIITTSVTIYIIQVMLHKFVWNRIFGDPLQKFIDLCSLCNISVFMLLEHSFGYYIHGRSPNGFADTDMYSMLLQIQRDSQQGCPRKGLLGDSDQQSYVILPPLSLRIYFQKLLAPFEPPYSMPQSHFQKEINTTDAAVERSSAAYSSMNRFLCAFIDHAIKDMDYIIKEKTLIEKLFNCEFENYLTESKGTFYIDNAKSFDRLLLYGNSFNIILMELTMLIIVFILTHNLIASTVVVYLFNKLIQNVFLKYVRHNVTSKTSIDKRFLM
ncbi:meckelin isoform X3 [Eurosta solidaginis]|uniref:meckelin isoform X3 n=1 Tax=Eurosta solidaginis TaxID=178769 RepID=UPI0035312C4B